MPDTNYPNGIDVGSLKINGVAVSATPEEMNQLSGAGALKADLQKLHAITKTADEINDLPIVEQAAVDDVAAADAVAAAGANPTKEEFDAVVTLANELKAQLNTALTALRTANIIAE